MMNGNNEKMNCNDRLEDSKRIDELYDKALSAMRKYAGMDASLNGDILTDSAWTKIDWNKFRLNNSVRIDIDKFFEYYGLEDHYFYLACIKGFGTPIKIKIHIDPCSSIEIVSSIGFSGTIWPWELEERLFYIRLLPDMPEDFEWRDVKPPKSVEMARDAYDNPTLDEIIGYKIEPLNLKED